jgi:hypothetical protein
VFSASIVLVLVVVLRPRYLPHQQTEDDQENSRVFPHRPRRRPSSSVGIEATSRDGRGMNGESNRRSHEQFSAASHDGGRLDIATVILKSGGKGEIRAQLIRAERRMVNEVWHELGESV